MKRLINGSRCHALHVFILLSFLLLLILITGGARTIQWKAYGGGWVAATSSAPVLVFDVQQNASTIFISPVTLYEDGHFKSPYAKERGEAARRRFVEKYFSAGQQYILIFGGGNAGTVTITSGYWQDGSYAYGQLNPDDDVKGRIRGQVHALATNWDTTARGSAWRRAPTAEERSGVIDLAKTVLLQNKVPSSALSKMEVLNLTAIDVDGDNKAELVGSFKAPQGQADKPPHHLFLIAEGAGQNFKVAKAEYQFNPQQSEYSLGSQLLADYLDIDGDGIGEVITTYEGANFITSFRIYQKKNGVWGRVYSGGGSH